MSCAIGAEVVLLDIWAAASVMEGGSCLVRNVICTTTSMKNRTSASTTIIFLSRRSTLVQGKSGCCYLYTSGERKDKTG